MTPDAVIFDFDGVLANSEPLHFGVYQRLLAEEGLAFTSDEYYSRYLGFDDVGVFEALARDKGLRIGDGRLTALIDRKTALFQSIVRTTPVLYPGAREAVLAIGNTCPIAIASGALRHEIEMILAGGGLGGVVPVIVAAGETPHGKPAPDPFARAVEQLSERAGRRLVPSRCVGIEDSHWGLQSARQAGLRTIGLTTSYPATQLPEADLILPDIAHVTIARLEALVAGGVPEPEQTA
jgi:beta-phosphoglucomutase-like phosphatase (HAD superfamily)